MEWPTAGIGLKGALGEESLAHDWRIEQLERLGLLFQFADVFAAAFDWHAMGEVVSRGCPSEPPRGYRPVPMGRLLAPLVWWHREGGIRRRMT
jgi:hypothetical protein